MSVGDGDTPRVAGLVHGVGVAVEDPRRGRRPSPRLGEGPVRLRQAPRPALGDDRGVDLGRGVGDVDEQVLEAGEAQLGGDGLDGCRLFGEEEDGAAFARGLGDDRGDEAGDAGAGRGVDVEVLARGARVEDRLLVGRDVEDGGVGDARGRRLGRRERLARAQGRRRALGETAGVDDAGQVGQRLGLAVGEGGDDDPLRDVELGQVGACLLYTSPSPRD